MPAEPLVDFGGKVVLISGASSGIGSAVAVILARYGAKLILVGRDEEKLRRTSEQLEGAEHCSVRLDLARAENIIPAVAEVSRKLGPIYGLCHAAGLADTLPLRVTNPEHIRSILEVNLIAGIELARAITSRGVRDPDGGSIVFISSIYGLVGKPGVIGYSASKGAIASAARSMAVELASSKIRVNLLSPGLVWTDMTREALGKLSRESVKKIEDDHPLRTGTPEDVARAAAFLLAPQNSWITGADLVIDGGYTAK